MRYNPFHRVPKADRTPWSRKRKVASAIFGAALAMAAGAGATWSIFDSGNGHGATGVSQGHGFTVTVAAPQGVLVPAGSGYGVTSQTMAFTLTCPVGSTGLYCDSNASPAGSFTTANTTAVLQTSDGTPTGNVFDALTSAYVPGCSASNFTLTVGTGISTMAIVAGAGATDNNPMTIAISATAPTACGSIQPQFVVSTP